MFLRAAKTEAEEAGESTEGMAGSVSELRQEILDLTGQQVDIQIDEDTFKSTYQILQDLSAVWDSLTDVSQANILELIGGKRNANVVSALLENFSIAEKALNVSAESAGSALAEHDKYLSSIEGSIAEFTAQFQSLSATIIDGNLVKDIVEIGTMLLSAVELVGKFINIIGGLNKVLAITAATVGAIKFDSIITKVMSIGSKIQKTTPIVSTFINSFKDFQGIGKLMGASDFESVLMGINGGLKAVIDSLTAAQAIALQFVAVFATLALVSSSIEKIQDQIRQKNEEVISINTNAVNESKSVYDLYMAYEQAKVGLDDSAESKQALLTASENLVTALGYEKDAVDKLDNSYKNLTLSELEAAMTKAGVAVDAAEKNLASLLNVANNATNSKFLTSKAWDLGFNFYDAATPAERAGQLLQVYDELVKEQGELYHSGRTGTSYYKKVSDAIAVLSPQVSALSDANTVLAEATDRYNVVLNETGNTQAEVAESSKLVLKSLKDVFTEAFGDSGLSDVTDRLESLKTALSSLSEGSLGVEDVVKLVQQFPELADYVDFTNDSFGDLDKGLKELIAHSPDEFINSLQEFKVTNGLTGEAAAQIDALCDSVGNLPIEVIKDASGEFGVLADAINAATDAQNALEEALAEDDWDAGYEDRVKAFEGFREVFKSGEYGSKAYAAYKEYFGLIEKTPDQIEEWIKSNKKYFTEGTKGIVAFLDKIESMDGAGEALDGIASYDSDTGAFWYDINRLADFADALGWTEEMLQDFIYKYRMYTEEWTSRSAQDSLTELTNVGIIFDDGGETFAHLDKLREYTQLSVEEINSLVSAMNILREQQGLEPIQLIGNDQIVITQQYVDNLIASGASVEDIRNKLRELAAEENVVIEAGIKVTPPDVSGIEADQGITVTINMGVDDDAIMAQIETTASNIEAILGKDWKAKISGDTVDAEEHIDAVGTLLEGLPSDTPVAVTDDTLTVRNNLSSVINYLSNIEANKNKKITITYDTSGIPTHAKGTKSASTGPALLGDEYSASGAPKPELVVSGNKAYVAGQNGPELGYLNEGDVVYTASETKKILRGNILHKSFNAFAGGLDPGLAGGAFGSVPSSSSKGSSKKSSSSASSSKDSWFEKQLKEHQHLLEMEKETMADYLKWLEDAHQKAYNEGVIDLDDYRKYQEEVYSGLKDLFKDHLNDIDHEISLLEGTVGSSDKIIALALDAIIAIEKELSAARAAGIDENGDYIQYLEQQWIEYTETVTELREQAESDAKDSVEDLVEYRIKMLKQEIEDQKDALNEKLDDLGEFYDKQKKMLQDQYDEEKYLEEQQEKRKSVSDINAELEMLKNDNSAWAQKRRLELQQELTEASKELSDFEKDHALDKTLEMLDEQQSSQEAQIQAQIDALDEKLNDPHALYNQALNDIRNNTAELYQQFIEYNRKHDSGKDEDIIEMWREAYIADLEYKDLHGGASKDGISIGNYTGYVVPENVAPPAPTQTTTPSDNAGNSSDRSAPALTKGSVITVKKSATHYGSKSGNAKMASFVPGGSYTVYKTSGSEVLIGKNGVYTGWVKKSDIVGYSSGTDHSIGGLAQWDEEGKGSEYIFESSDGNRYRMFAEGSKVLDADATNFLYNFATSGGAIISKLFEGILGSSNFSNIFKPAQAIQLSTGDIIVQGNADKRTVSEIRRAQRENLEFVIKEFNKLNR